MLKRVRLKTWVVDGRREASTVLAMSAAFVESEAGNLCNVNNLVLRGVSSGMRGLLCFWASAVVEGEHIDAHEPGAQRPDAVAACGFGEGFEDWREA